MAAVDDLFTALDAIRAADDGSFAVVTVGAAGHAAQFLAVDGGLLVEVVADGERRPAPSDEDDLRARGWTRQESGAWAYWARSPDAEACRGLALDALSALDEVFGASGAVRVETFPAPPPEPEGAARQRVLVAAIAAFLALLGAVVALVLAGG